MIDALQYPFMQNALSAGLLASVACGIIGTYVVVRKMVFISGGIAHASFGGLGIGYFFGFNPVFGALLFTPAAALCIGFITKKAKVPEDTLIGILWAMGMALGLILIGIGPGQPPDLMSYLFGNIITLSSFDIKLMLFLDVAIITIVVLLYKEFLAIAFDEEFGTVVGVPANHLYFLLLCLIAFSVVVLTRFVGIILVIALLTIPAAIARQYTHNLVKMMMLSVLIGVISTCGGLWLSYEIDLETGPTIILVSGTLFLISLAFPKLRHNRNIVLTGR